MPKRVIRYRSWVQVLVPGKDRHDEKLLSEDIELWKSRGEQIFRQHLDGYQILAHYKIEGIY